MLYYIRLENLEVIKDFFMYCRFCAKVVMTNESESWFCIISSQKFANLPLLSALDKSLSNWVFWAIFTHPFLIELGIRIFLWGTLFCNNLKQGKI